MQSLEQIIETNARSFQFFVDRNFNHLDEFERILFYAAYPPGKLFRSLLLKTLAKDLEYFGSQLDLDLYGYALELHHTYTLVHDDLPAMDNDDTRRGKPSAHRAFGEWQAILTGDALLNFSYQLLAQIQHVQSLKLLKLFADKLGYRGLIKGQFLDLQKGVKTFDRVLEIHCLKTANLIQLSSVGAAVLCGQDEKINKYEHFGFLIGRYFQLLDDWDDFQTKSDDDLNIFYIDSSKAKTLMGNTWQEIEQISKQLGLELTRELLKQLKTHKLG